MMDGAKLLSGPNISTWEMGFISMHINEWEWLLNLKVCQLNRQLHVSLKHT